MKETIKERFTLFLKYLGIGQGKFEKITDIGNGTINNIKDGISTPKLAKISEAYPELNIEWLITGNGTMLKTSQVSEPQAPYGTNSGDYITMPREVWEVIQKQMNDTTRMIDMLQQELDRYKERESQSKAG